MYLRTLFLCALGYNPYGAQKKGDDVYDMNDAGGPSGVERQGADDISAELLEEWAQLADAYGKTGLNAQDIFMICKNT